MNFLFVIDTDWMRQTYRLQYHYLARYLVKKGHRVYVLDFPNLYRREGHSLSLTFDASTGAHVFRPSFIRFPLLDRYTASLAALTLIRKIEENVGIDVVVNGSITYIPPLLKVNKPMVYFPIDLVSAPTFMNPLLGHIAKWYETIYAHKARYIFVLTNDMKKELVQRGIECKKIFVTPSGVDVDVFVPNPEVGWRFREDLGLENQNVVLYLGAIRDGYGLKELIKSIPKVREAVTDEFTYLFVGYSRPAWYLDELKRLADRLGVSDRVLFHKAVPFDKVPIVINAADVCVVALPPNAVGHNAFPIKLLEYMACGRSVVCTPLSGVMSRFKEKESGILYMEYGSKGFAESISELLTSKGKRERLGVNARSSSRVYAWNIVWTPIERILTELKKV